MQFNEPKNETTCPGCGKIVPKRDKRAKINFCSRVCQAKMRFATRYQGSNSGPADRPLDLTSKTKWDA